MKFFDCGEPLGLYPIVESVSWLEKLLPLGVKTVQLRVKNKNAVVLEDEIQRAILIANQFNARLFINDYWELAIRYQAYGVHLGQEDLDSADIKKIYQAGLRLGISTHTEEEVQQATQLNPSYIACGPVYATTSKVLPFKPIGIIQLQNWRDRLNIPIVAIGGIKLDRMFEVLATGIDGVAVISAITKASDPIEVVREMLKVVGN